MTDTAKITHWRPPRQSGNPRVIIIASKRRSGQIGARAGCDAGDFHCKNAIFALYYLQMDWSFSVKENGYLCHQQFSYVDLLGCSGIFNPHGLAIDSARSPLTLLEDRFPIEEASSVSVANKRVGAIGDAPKLEFEVTILFRTARLKNNVPFRRPHGDVWRQAPYIGQGRYQGLQGRINSICISSFFADARDHTQDGIRSGTRSAISINPGANFENWPLCLRISLSLDHVRKNRISIH